MTSANTNDAGNCGEVLVSVIMPIYNAAVYLEEALGSVCQQSYRPIEVVMYNDCSSDNSWEVANRYSDNLAVHGVQYVLVNSALDKPQGPGAGRNQCVAHSHGEYLCHLDSDDIMHPLRIEKQLSLCLEKGHTCLVGSNFVREPAGSTEFYTEWINGLTQEQLLTHQYRECTIICPSWFMHRSLFHNVAEYRMSFNDAGDIGSMTQVSGEDIEGRCIVETQEQLHRIDTNGYCGIGVDGKSSTSDSNTPTNSDRDICTQGYVHDNGEDLYFFLDHLASGGSVAKVCEPLITYRYHLSSVSHGTSSVELQRIRIMYLQRMVIDYWPSFSIWGYGRDGKKFINMLTKSNANKVACFCDVHAPKIGAPYFNNYIRKNIPIIDYREVVPPFIVCVGMKRSLGDLERNVESLGLVEGVDYYYFC